MAEEGYAIAEPDEEPDAYADSDVPGEFRRLGERLGGEQLSASFIRIPPHSDFEQGTGHTHERIEELYLIVRGTLTMRFGEDVRAVSAPAAVRVDPQTTRSHRNEGEETVEMWAVSPKQQDDGGTKIEDFWQASPRARQSAGG